jgi:hypothetical protein
MHFPSLKLKYLQVLLGSSNAHPLLLCFRFYCKAETHSVFQMVPRLLSKSEVAGLGNLERQHSFEENVNFSVESCGSRIEMNRRPPVA